MLLKHLRIRWVWTYRDKDGLVTYGTGFQVVAKRMFRTYPIDDQTFTGLWEGLCDVSGRVGTSQLTGQAFVELNAY